MKTQSSKSVIFGLVTSAILAFNGSQAISQTNLISNPDFSNGSTGWSTNCTIEINPENVYGGSVSSNRVTEIDTERCLYQDVTVTPGAIYALSYRAARRIGGPTPATVGVNVRVIGRQSGTLYLDLNRTYSQSVWSYTAEHFTVYIPAGVTDSQVRIRFNNYLTTGTYGTLIDDIFFAADISAAVMPLNIISFAGSLNSNGVQLNWTAENNEQDGKNFVIERMSAGGSFTAIGSVPASVTGRQYSFVDNNPSVGKIQYRLKAMNQDGSSSYSNIIIISNGNKAASEVSVYPNPAIHTISISLNAATQGNISIAVYNASGMIVASKQAILNEGTNTVQVDVSSLKPGTFYLRVNGNGEGMAKAFCKK